MKIKTRELTLCAVLAALALALSYMESFFPLALIVPLPGVKLGLANIVTVFALYQLGAAPALCILVARCLLGSLFAGNASALLFSLLGGVLGLVKCALLLFLAVWVLQKLQLLVTPELVNKTVLLKFFAQNSPIDLIAKL